MKNVLTFDVEDYFHVLAFAGDNPAESWTKRESRVERNTDRVIEILDARGVKATFFTLGWVAEHHPQVVRNIIAAGHEISCHSFWHRQVFELPRGVFREDTRIAKEKIEQAGGSPVRGYRAPNFSINNETGWALEVLAELGFVYDSSLFPVRHPNYGFVRCSRRPYMVATASGPILEVPMPTLELGSMRAPIGGGAYFRLLPYWYTRWAIESNNREGIAACIYFHPWEFDPDQPQMNGGLTSRIRHYLGLRGTEKKFRHLLQDFAFGPMIELVQDFRSQVVSVQVQSAASI